MGEKLIAAHNRKIEGAAKSDLKSKRVKRIQDERVFSCSA